MSKMRKILILLAALILTGCESKEEKIAKVFDEWERDLEYIQSEDRIYPQELRNDLLTKARAERDKKLDRLGYERP